MKWNYMKCSVVCVPSCLLDYFHHFGFTSKWYYILLTTFWACSGRLSLQKHYLLHVLRWTATEKVYLSRIYQNCQSKQQIPLQWWIFFTTSRESNFLILTLIPVKILWTFQLRTIGRSDVLTKIMSAFHPWNERLSLAFVIVPKHLTDYLQRTLSRAYNFADKIWKEDENISTLNFSGDRTSTGSFTTGMQILRQMRSLKNFEES